MPTSLIYIALSTRGCAPWRPDAVMSTTRGENNTRRRIFKGRRRCAEPGRGCPAFPDGAPYRRIIRFQGPPAPSTRTENSRPDRRRRLRPRLRRRSISTSRSGNVDPVPFRQAGRPRPPNLLTGFPYLSGSTQPVSNCCSHGTFLHFSLQSSHLNICYDHQDLHWGPFHPGSRRGLCNKGPTPSYSRVQYNQEARPGISRSLQRHPFSGLVHSAGELLHTP